MQRRDFLSLGLTTASLASFSHKALANTPAVDLSRAEGWDYPAIDALLPFGHGLKSGDPLADRVVIWTRVSIPDSRGWLAADPQGLTEVAVDWVVARDPELTAPVAQGQVLTNAQADWTVKIDVDGLQPATDYWFAFAALGRGSIIGRTRTAPAPDDRQTPVRVMQTACSKYWAGYFSMYGRMADRNDVDVLIHSGDHIYNKQNANRGTIRLPEAALAEEDYEHIDVRDWARPEEVGRRYALYCTDPDLLRAHAALPFVIMPDQHDTTDKDDRGIYGGDGVSNAQAAEYFHLWNADRPLAADGSGSFAAQPRVNLNLSAPRGEHARLFYKHLPYGGLLDIISIDMRRSQESDKSNPFLSEAQWAFLEQALQSSADRGVTWRVMVNGVCMSQMNLLDSPVIPDSVREEFFGGPDLNGVLVYGGWNDADADRRRLYAYLRSLNLHANLVLTGDIHGQFVAELVEDNELPAYVPGTGLGTLGRPVGVEIMTGATSGGADEVAAATGYEAANGRPPGMDPQFQSVWVPGARPVAKALEAAIRLATPNLRYSEWSDDAYALLHLTPDQAICELWRVDKRDPDSAENLMWQGRIDPEHMNVQAQRPATPTQGGRRSAGISNPPIQYTSGTPAASRAQRSGAGGSMGLAALAAAGLVALRQRRATSADPDGEPPEGTES